MRGLLFLTLSVAAIAAVLGAPEDSIPGIVDLTPDNFDKIVNGGKHALVEFYAPWCGHCKSMVPELKKLGEMIEADPKLKSRFVVGKVNADEHRSLGDKFEVKGFPTIKYFKRGAAPTKDSGVDYQTARTAPKFMEFMKTKLEEDKGFARVEALDSIAKKFMAGDHVALLKEATTAAASLAAEAKDNAGLYLKFMEKAVEKGKDYLATEKARLDKMLAAGGVAANKIEEFARKSSVLGAFLPEDDTKEAAV